MTTTLTLALKPVNISKFTHEQLDMARKKAESIPNKQLTYEQFITSCKIYLEIEKRLEILLKS